MKLTQPVMVQSFQDEFELNAHGKYPMTPSEPGKLLSKGENKVTVSKEEQKTYISGVGKMLHMIHWSRPDILNPICERLMMMSFTMEAHIISMKRIIKYVVDTADRGQL